MTGRERYSRPDVPTPGRRRSLVALLVLLALAVALALGVWLLWRQANTGTTLGDSSLAASLDDARDAASLPDGAEASGDEFRNVLLLLVDDVSSDSPALRSVSVMCLNVSKNSGTLVSVPTEAAVAVGSETMTLAEAFSSQGDSACVAPLARATGLSFEHVIVLDQDGMDMLESLSSSGATDIVGKASELLGMMRTDMGATDLLDLAETAQAIGIGNLSRVEAPTVTGDGSSTVSVDATGLGLALGTLVSS